MFTSSSTTDAVTASSPSSSLTAPLARLRARGFDAACNLEEILQQFHQPAPRDDCGSAVPGNVDGTGEGTTRAASTTTLEHLWRLGKHFALVSSSSIDDTTDKEYDRRLKATTHSKSLLLQIEHEFETVCKAVGHLSDHYDTLLDLLEKFRSVCDGELLSTYTKQKQQLDQEMSSFSSNAGSPQSPPSQDGGGGNNAFDSKSTEADERLESLRSRLKESSNVLREAIQTSCAPMSLVTRTHLDETQTRVVSRVAKLQCDYDLLRYQMAKGDYCSTTTTTSPSSLPVSAQQQQQQYPTGTTATPPPSSSSSVAASGRDSGGYGGGGGMVVGGAKAAFSALVNINPLSSMMGALSGHSHNNNVGRALGAEGEAGFTVDEEGNTIINRPAGVAGGLGVSSANSTSYTSSAVNRVSMNSAVPLSTREEMVAANIAYESELQQAKGILHDALEQTSMSTWSCYNVFFSQMAQYFSDVQKGNTELAKCLIALKNSQQVSKKLTEERRDRLVSMRKSAESEIVLQNAFTMAAAKEELPPSVHPHRSEVVDPFADMFTTSQSGSHRQHQHPPTSSTAPPLGVDDGEDDEYGDFTSSSTSAAVVVPDGGRSGSLQPTSTPPSSTRPAYAPTDLDNLFK